MHYRVRLQVAEALGALNRWYCSQAYGQKIDDVELLLTYYIKSGGAADFDKRYQEAMSPLNRWYCSQFHRRDIREPHVLWEYYNRCASGRRSETPRDDRLVESDWSIAS